MPSGFVYEGAWSQGEIDGQGTATYANGDVYEGTFVAGKRQGQGTMRYATGEEAAGAWDNGTLQEASEDATDAAPADGSDAEAPTTE